MESHVLLTITTKETTCVDEDHIGTDGAVFLLILSISLEDLVKIPTVLMGTIGMEDNALNFNRTHNVLKDSTGWVSAVSQTAGTQINISDKTIIITFLALLVLIGMDINALS